MNTIENLQNQFIEFLCNTFAISTDEALNCRLELNIDESKQQFGDLSSNAALILSKKLKGNPRSLAQNIADTFKSSPVREITVAGPGFINIFLTNEAFSNIASELHEQKNNFFSSKTQEPLSYNIEFVSANPTGPLHFGHGRGAIIGDVLGNILKFLGNSTTKEFYINDAGVQMKKLGGSLKIRCQQQLGSNIQLPEDAYQGDYLVDLSKKCIQEHGKSIAENPVEFFSNYGKQAMLKLQKETLDLYGVHFDVWFSEKNLHSNSLIENAVETLKKNDYIYEKDGALWFTATKFGDDKDRVIRKTDGNWTYMAPDIAYLVNKVERKFDRLVMILGHDHHSYAVRLEAVRTALGLKSSLDVILYQLVKIKEDGQFLRMSKRAGRMITLKSIIELVGTDVARFFYLNRKADGQLEFDIELALKKTDENPVYYVQYAYVRTNSILKKSQAIQELANIDQKDIAFLGSDEALLIKKMISLKSMLKSIAINYQTHLLTYYVIELATSFHKYYAKHKVLNPENLSQSRARLLVIKLINQTLGLCLDLLGISKPEKM